MSLGRLYFRRLQIPTYAPRLPGVGVSSDKCIKLPNSVTMPLEMLMKILFSLSNSGPFSNKQCCCLISYHFPQTFVSSQVNYEEFPNIVVRALAVKALITIRPVALSGYGSIAHEAKLNGLLTRGP